MGYYKEEWNGNEWLGAKCDNCGEIWEHWNEGWTLMPDELALWPELDDSGWTQGNTKSGEGKDGELYCDKCWHYDDEDNFILNPKTIKND